MNNGPYEPLKIGKFSQTTRIKVTAFVFNVLPTDESILRLGHTDRSLTRQTIWDIPCIRVSEFVFNVLPTALASWRQGHTAYGLISDWSRRYTLQHSDGTTDLTVLQPGHRKSQYTSIFSWVCMRGPRKFF